jgi:hypothetical protein
MKGQEVVTAILITGILLGLVGSVYLWGVPLIEKNKDVSLLQSAEEFMHNLDEKIKDVATHGGREQIEILLGRVYFESDINLNVETKNTIYASGASIPLARNDCTMDKGIWGVDDQDVLCVLSKKIGDKYETDYILRYINLTLGTKTYKIELLGEKNSGKKDNSIIIERTGTEKEGDYVKTLILIRIE